MQTSPRPGWLVRTAVICALAAGATGFRVADPAAGAAAEEQQAPEGCGRLRAEGRMITCADGRPFRWRGITGFRLVHQVAAGDDTAARAYLAWVRDSGFNLIRTLSTASLLFDLSPEDGRAALPRALSLAREYGLYVELATVIDTAERDYDWRGHARQVAEACAREPNCVFEFANEPGHGVQDVQLHDMAAVDRFAADATARLDLLWTAGPSWGSDMAHTPAGAFVVRHLDRGGSPWDMARRFEGFESLSAELGKPVVSNEPIGFDEVDGAVTGRQRITDCDAALVFGALSRAFEVGMTFHLQAGLQNEVPGPVQRRCAGDFIRGTRLVPDEAVLVSREVGQEDSPVETVALDRVTGFVVGASASEGLAVAFGLDGDPGPVWREGTRADLVAERPNVRIWRLVRR